MILHETTAPSFFHCENMCLHEFQCRDFGYNSSSELCRMNAADFRFSLVDSLTECEILCAMDATCLGYFFKADEKKCKLSNSNVSKSTPWCEYCIFSTKQCSNGKYNSTHCVWLSPSALQMLKIVFTCALNKPHNIPFNILWLLRILLISFFLIIGSFNQFSFIFPVCLTNINMIKSSYMSNDQRMMYIFMNW